jgi:diguanylate cyclase (GGDEF)-like protein
MDPTTVIIVLATHLICTGGLLFLAGRQMPPRCGLGPWALGLVLFGSAYLARLLVGTPSSPWNLLVPDVAMVAATVLFVAGLQQFVGRDPLRWRPAAAGLAAYALLEAWVIAQWGHHGRHTLLNIGLGLAYVGLAWNAAAARREVAPPLAAPLRFLAAVMGLMALLTIARGLHIGVQGTAVVLNSTFAKVYYAYASLAAVLLAMGLMWMLFVRLTTQLADLATRDALTRLLNRNGLQDALRRHFGTRPPRPLTLLMVDADHFKRVNDEHGHAAGDRVLAALADTLARHVRPSDLVARMGGEEFVVCTTADHEAARTLAERLRSAVAAATFAHDGGALRCTVSVGISPPLAGLDGWDAAYAAADRALYAAKSAGRDRVVAASATA